MATLFSAHASPDDDGKSAYCRRWNGIKRIWAGKDIPDDANFGIQRVAMLFVELVVLVSPTIVIQFALEWLVSKVSGSRKLYHRKCLMEVYTLSKPAILLVLLFSLPSSLVWVLVAVVLLVDLYFYWFSILLIGRYFSDFISVKRTMILLVPNVLEQFAAFAHLYRYSGGIANGNKVLSDPGDAIYFSIVTATTLGYGDFAPSKPEGQFLVCLQLLLSLVIIGIILAYIIGRIDSESHPADRSKAP